MNSLSWLRPELLWGVAAAALPVLIHLLGRKRRRTVKFATLRFLERAAAKASARLKLKRMLLLIARMIALASLAAFFAAPGFVAERGEAKGLTALVVDTSLSMSVGNEGETLLEQAKAELSKIISNSGDADSFLIVTTSASGPSGELEPVDGAEAMSRVSTTKTAAEDYGVVRALERADAAIASNTLSGEYGAIRILLATDMQRHAWRDHQGLTALRSPVKMVELDAVSTENLYVNSFTQSDSTFEVELGGASSEGRAKVVFTYGREEPRSLTAFVEDGSARFTPAPELVPELVRVEVEPGGALGFDDRLELVSVPSGAIDLLLVNGDPRGFEIRDELLFLKRALTSEGRLAKRVAVREVRQSDLDAEALKGVDVVWLANPAQLSMEQATLLDSLMEEGLGVVVSAGGQWSAQRTGDFLEKLLAAPLRDKIAYSPDDKTRPPFISPDTATFSGPFAFDDAEQELTSLLGAVRVGSYWLADVGLDEGATVLAKLENNVPLIVARERGRGRSVLLATSIDRDWADLCLSPAFLPFVERMVTYAAGRTATKLPSHVIAGTELYTPYAEEVYVKRPDSKVQGWSPQRPLLSPDSIGAHTIYGDQELTKRLGGFVVRPDPQESELERISATQLSSAKGKGLVFEEGLSEGNSGRKDYSHVAAIVLLICLAAEALLSARLPRRGRMKLEREDVG